MRGLDQAIIKSKALAPRVQWWSSAVAAAFGVEVLELLTLVGSLGLHGKGLCRKDLYKDKVAGTPVSAIIPMV